jgi:hypothetical protein
MTTKALERQVGRVFSPRAHCGLNATGVTSPIRKIFGRDVAVWVFALEKLRGLDRDGFDVAIGARFAVNEDFELSAGWISNLHLPQSSSATAGRLGLPVMGTY